MKYIKRYLFFGLFCILGVFDTVFCNDSIYEKISSYVQDSEIVDPHSLYYNRQAQKIVVPQSHKYADSNKNEMVVGHRDNYQSYCKDSPYEVFARRLINMLISKSNFKISNEMAVGQVEIEATLEELDILTGFGEGKISIRQLDSIISNIIRPVQISLFDEALNYTDRFAIYIYQHRVIFSTMLLIVFVIIIALKVKWTRMRIIFLIFDIMIIISFMLTWWELLQESMIKLTTQQTMYSKMPAECRQDEISFYSSVLLFFGIGKGDCEKYFEAVMTNPALKITPLHAFSHMCSKLIFYPLSIFGDSLSKFIENISSSLPWPFNIMAKLLLVLFMPSIVCLLFFIFFGASMGIRLGPFFHVYVHGRQSTPPPNSLSNGDRQAIEVIRSNIHEAALPSTKAGSASSIKNNVGTVEVSTQCEETSVENSEKQEENSTNSDEFPEEKEYEKISLITLKDVIDKCSDGESVQKEAEKDDVAVVLKKMEVFKHKDD